MIKDENIDEELQAIGVKFTDETAPKQMPNMERKCQENTCVQKKPVQKCEPVDATRAPVPKREPDFGTRLKGCVKGVGPCAIISGVLFWWQQEGLLASEAAWPSFIVLALLAGLEIGRHALR